MPGWEWWGAFAVGWMMKDLYMQLLDWWNRKKADHGQL